MIATRPEITRFIRPKEVAKIFGCTVQTIYTWEKEDPDFPTKYRMGPNSVGYDSDELYDYYEQRIELAEPELEGVKK